MNCRVVGFWCVTCRKSEAERGTFACVAMLVIEPGMRGASQKLDDADKLAAKPNTDKAAAMLTQEFLKTVRQLVTTPNEEFRREAIRLSREAKWKLKLDTYRTYQLWKTAQAAAREQLPFGGMRRPGFKMGR